jgi:heterodisulfide reductase subunit A
MAGMACALAIAERGFDVHLVERQGTLGGNARRAGFSIEGHDVREWAAGMAERLERHPGIRVHRNAGVAEVTGSVGDFRARLDTDEDPGVIGAGVIVLATGGEARAPAEHLYGRHPRVLTQQELDDRLRSGAAPGAGSVVMIQCVGTRNEERPYCSRVCCSQALSNAVRLKELDPATEVTVLYRDIMSYGLAEQRYVQARERGVCFIRHSEEHPPEVQLHDAAIAVGVRDPVLGGDLILRPDWLVLSPGIVPADNGRLAEVLGVELTDDGFFREADANFRPVQTIKEGVLVCGLAHSPRSAGETFMQAHAVARRASSILGRTELRSAQTVAEVTDRWCVGCEICLEVCPYGARTANDDDKVVVVNEALCRGCGGCAVACPGNATRMAEFSDRQVLAMMDAAGGI